MATSTVNINPRCGPAGSVYAAPYNCYRQDRSGRCRRPLSQQLPLNCGGMLYPDLDLVAQQGLGCGASRKQQNSRVQASK